MTIDVSLSKNFTLSEFTNSDYASAHGIDNTKVTVETVNNLSFLCYNVLEKVREHYGKAVTPQSGYRCPELNTAIGGSYKSQHVKGQAVDFEISTRDNKMVFLWMRANLEYDQLILEKYREGEPDSGWIHVSYNKGSNRNQAFKLE
jgi:uncharacterized protein YcbK (DUF882 family)